MAQFLIRHQRTDDALKVLDANSGNLRVKNQRIEALLKVGNKHEGESPWRVQTVRL